MIEYGMKRADSGKYDINLSRIINELIHMAAEYTDRYAGDLFITWSHIENDLNDGKIPAERVYIGFRETGIDSSFDFYHLRKNDERMYGTYKKEVCLFFHDCDGELSVMLSDAY